MTDIKQNEQARYVTLRYTPSPHKYYIVASTHNTRDIPILSGTGRTWAEFGTQCTGEITVKYE